jgi:hypothetical protein
VLAEPVDGDGGAETLAVPARLTTRAREAEATRANLALRDGGRVPRSMRPSFEPGTAESTTSS